MLKTLFLLPRTPYPRPQIISNAFIIRTFLARVIHATNLASSSVFPANSAPTLEDGHSKGGQKMLAGVQLLSRKEGQMYVICFLFVWSRRSLQGRCRQRNETVWKLSGKLSL